MHSRRTFISAASAIAGVALAAPAAGGATLGSAGRAYDLAAIDACLNLPFAHRQAFGAHRLADGSIASFMLNSLNAYQFDYGDGPGTLHALGILYGSAVAMVVDDAMWRKYNIALVQQRRGDAARTTNATGGNPYLSATTSLDPAATRTDLHGLYHDSSLTALIARKASFFACDNALTGLATDIAVTFGTSGEPAATVHADLRAHLLPGTLLVPAGVAAVNQAQEAKFTFISASV